jgi:hypothetical protein
MLSLFFDIFEFTPKLAAMKMPIVICTLSFISSCIYSQKGFSPGWIVKTSGDTVQGYLMEEVRKNILETIKFRPDSINSPIQVYAVSEIRSFKYQDGNFYQTINYINSSKERFTDDTCFARLLVGGSYNLYEVAKDGKTFYIIKGENASYFLFNTSFYTNGELEREGNYLVQLSQLVTTCNATNLHPERVGYTQKEMTGFVLQLDNYISPHNAATSFYHKPKQEIHVVIFAGGLPLGSRSQLTFDAELRIGFPQIEPGMSFNIGFHRSSTYKQLLRADYTFVHLYTKTDHTLTGIPLSLQYNFTKGIVQPYIYVGGSATYLSVNPDNPYDPYDGNEIYGNNKLGLQLLAGLGVEIFFNNWLAAKVDWRYEYILQYPAVGLAIKF